MASSIIVDVDDVPPSTDPVDDPSVTDESSIASVPLTSPPSGSVGNDDDDDSVTADPEATNHRGMALLRELWTTYYPPGAFGEFEPRFPGRSLKFTIVALFAFAGIKAQRNTGFPFQTNCCATKVSIGSVIMFALASGAEHIFSVGRPARTSAAAIVARWAIIVAIGIFGGSLVWLLLV